MPFGSFRKHETVPFSWFFNPSRSYRIAMSDPNAPPSGPSTRELVLQNQAALEVLFEALAHIQASFESESEDRRAETYRLFKDALLKRYEYLLNERMNADASDTVMPSPEPRDDVRGDDTLNKLWPEISKTLHG